VVAGQLIREARRRAGLSQQDLAGRAGLHQPAIARWEGGRTEPSLATLIRVVTACGFELRLRLTPAAHDEPSTFQNLVLSPEQRLDQLVRTVRFIEEGRRQMTLARG
jgi:transcriptional regulator with XRE-family HTH domain